MRPRAERLAEYVRLSALLPQAAAELMRYEGVGTVAVGIKERKGEPTDDIVFRVYVAEKKTPDRLGPGALIPTSVLGVPTDVVLHGTPLRIEDAEGYRPLMGGIRIGNDSTSAFGSLGCFAQRNGGDRSIVILSCHHVMLDGNATNGEAIGQPEVPCCCKGDYIVGYVVDAANNDLVDCAIARIKETVPFTNEIYEIGPVLGAAALNAGGSTVAPGDIVRKRGRSTGFTTGVVVAPSMTPPGGEKHSQIEMIAHFPSKKFADRGDSGSVMVNEDNVVVGLIWAIDKETEKLTFANIITNVTTAMDITILNSGTAGTIALGSTPVSAAVERAEEIEEPELPTDAIARELERSALGRRILAMIRSHAREVIGLISTNRQVKVSWHRYQGPSFTAHIIKSANEPDHGVPMEINGVSFTNMLIRVSVMLQEHGSAALAAAVEENALPLFNLLSGITSVRDLLEKITNADRGADRATSSATHG